MTEAFKKPLVVGEKRALTFRFNSELDPGEALSGAATVSVSVESGTDPSPSSILNGSATVDSPDVLVPVQALVSGITYRIKVLIGTTTATKTLGIEALLRVA